MPKTSDRLLAAISQPPVSPRLAAVLWAALALFVLYGSTNGPAYEDVHVSLLPGISLPDILQNVLLYVPFGTLGVLVLRDRSRSAKSAAMAVIAIAAVYSIVMEGLQLLLASRIASALDVIANVAGAGIGAASTPLVERGLTQLTAMLRPTGVFTAPARYAVLLVLCFAAAVAWYPFDITLDVSTLSERTRPVRNNPWLQPGTTELAVHAATYFVLAALLTASLPGLRKRAPAVAIPATIAAAIVIDVGQVAMGSRPVGVAVLLSQTVGAAAGAMLIAALAGKPSYADA